MKGGGRGSAADASVDLADVVTTLVSSESQGDGLQAAVGTAACKPVLGAKKLRKTNLIQAFHALCLPSAKPGGFCECVTLESQSGSARLGAQRFSRPDIIIVKAKPRVKSNGDGSPKIHFNSSFIAADFFSSLWRSCCLISRHFEVLYVESWNSLFGCELLYVDSISECRLIAVYHTFSRNIAETAEAIDHRSCCRRLQCDDSTNEFPYLSNHFGG